MKSYSRSHLSDGSLLSVAVARLPHGLTWEADHLADIAEIDRRRLYAPAGHSSMHSFCVKEWGLSGDCAFKRIRVARKARRFPVIFHMFADGRLHLTGLVLLAPHLNSRNAEELLKAATHKTKSEIAKLVAERFPKPDVPTSIRAIPLPALVQQLAPGPVGIPDSPPIGRTEGATGSMNGTSQVQLAPGPVEPSAPVRIQPEWRPQVTQLAAERFALKVTMSQEMNDDLRYAQDLMSHQMPSRDVAEVLHRGLKSLIRELEKRKFAATEKPRTSSTRPTSNPRHIPADVQRAVWQRDGGRCTFVSEKGYRCGARAFLEYDHVQEVARGGTASVSNVRLLCRAHNQYLAERTFGIGFMNQKREEARCEATDNHHNGRDARRVSDEPRVRANRDPEESLMAPVRPASSRSRAG